MGVRFFPAPLSPQTQDPDLIPTNVRNGIDILGTVGNMQPLTAGDTYFVNASPQKNSTSDNTFTKLKSIQVNQSGTYRVKFEMMTGDGVGSNQANSRIYVNGVARGTLRSTYAITMTAYTEDITINTGDTIELWSSGSGGFFAQIRNFQIGINNISNTIILN